MPRAATVLAALAFGLGACGGDDETAGDGSTATQPQRTTATAVAETPAPKIPEDTARDVEQVRNALEAAGFEVKRSKFPGQPLAQLEIGSTLVAFYASAGEASNSAAAIKKVFDANPGRGSVRASGKRLYTASQDGKDAGGRFSKIVSTAEGAL